ncbi:helix-turn-helix transcriptional regulator [Streptomyces sp. MP131-18]|uniref:helix-turn-helix transcriptional regulator n=1 Tax=Streptomyces sp. MP131-18 TaxID=1857892 RepID=UPI00097C924B|nr:helix-turn-helix transcriptional regulator [Streptomyces sp. MP131-18]ONK10294.1 helix-turn-helix protein [Streptomyces sp. MP131-18]
MEDNGHQLGAFLRARRARVAPESIGIAGGRRRRVRGLRREELAQLAGISVDYYVRLEQGRATAPSAEVLGALARALGLDATEREHLATLAGARARGTAPPGGPGDGVGAPLQRMLDGMAGLPAVVMDHRMTVVAWNALGSELFGRVAERDVRWRNHGRYTFLDPAARDFFPDWDERSREMVAVLRHAAGRHPDDAELTALIAELSAGSSAFRRLWETGDVLVCGRGTKRFHHPAVGGFPLDYETLHLPLTDGGPTAQMYVYSAPEGSEGAGALRALAARTAGAPVPATG